MDDDPELGRALLLSRWRLATRWAIAAGVRPGELERELGELVAEYATPPAVHRRSGRWLRLVAGGRR